MQSNKKVILLNKFNYNPVTGLISLKSGKIKGYITTGGYIQISHSGKRFMAHRLAWFLHHKEFPNGEIDHIDHNVTNNSISNLRVVDRPEQMKNCKEQINNTSGQTGVYWEKERKRWTARIHIDGKMKRIGRYLDYSKAVNARKNAEILYGYHENHGKK